MRIFTLAEADDLTQRGGRISGLAKGDGAGAGSEGADQVIAAAEQAGAPEVRAEHRLAQFPARFCDSKPGPRHSAFGCNVGTSVAV